MTVEEIQAKIDAKQVEIDDKTKQISVLTAKATSEDTQAAEWLAQSGVKCGKWDQDCKNDKIWKASKAQQHKDLANSYRKQIGVITTSINSLNAERNALITEKANAAKTSNQVSLDLATQGLTIEGIKTKAEGDARAAEIEATAKADAITSDANASASNKKIIGYVIALVLLLALAWGIVKIVKRRKNRK